MNGCRLEVSRQPAGQLSPVSLATCGRWVRQRRPVVLADVVDLDDHRSPSPASEFAGRPELELAAGLAGAGRSSGVRRLQRLVGDLRGMNHVAGERAERPAPARSHAARRCGVAKSGYVAGSSTDDVIRCVTVPRCAAWAWFCAESAPLSSNDAAGRTGRRRRATGQQRSRRRRRRRRRHVDVRRRGSTAGSRCRRDALATAVPVRSPRHAVALVGAGTPKLRELVARGVLRPAYLPGEEQLAALVEEVAHGELRVVARELGRTARLARAAGDVVVARVPDDRVVVAEHAERVRGGQAVGVDVVDVVA